MSLRAPHAHEGITIPTLMFKVILALLPAAVLGTLQFGFPALFLLLTCLVTALVCEAACQKLNPAAAGKLNDGSALLTALLLAMSLPPHAPMWIGALGTAFAILFGKQIYGGLGQNLFNPAMLARVVLLIAFPVEMTHWITPSDIFSGQWYGLNIDGLSGATTLGLYKEGKEQFDLLSHLMGLSSGSLGETAALLLVAGGLWLMQQQVFGNGNLAHIDLEKGLQFIFKRRHGTSWCLFHAGDTLKAYLFIGKIVPSFQTFVNSSLAAIRRQSETFREPLNNKPCILVKHAIQAFFQNTGLIFTRKYAFFAGWLLFF